MKYFWLLALLLPPLVFSSDLTTINDLDQQITTIQQDYAIPSLAIGVIAGGEIFFLGGAGDLGGNEARAGLGKGPVTGSTLFRVASISKLFTAQAIMQLAEKNQLNINDGIGDYLPGFEKTNITIKQLLTHSSGIKDQIRPEWSSEGRSVASYLTMVGKTVSDKDLVKQFKYSDTGFNLLGAIVSHVSGMPFEQYIKRHVLDPSLMPSSGYFDGEQGVEPDTTPHYKGAALSPAQQRPYDAAFYPSEGLVSNVSDLSHWLVATLNLNNKILSTPSYQQMLSPKLKTSWGEIHMGLGWQLYYQDEQLVARHPGSIRGFKSLIITYPEAKNALVILTNDSKAPRFKIAKRITELLQQHSIW